jgi:polysaccharide pyruvyl transferase CsaB
VPPRRLLIAGYYGHGNLGDEAILEAMLGGLREARPDVAVTIACGNPEATKARHQVRAVHERNWPALIEAAAASDAIVLGGGGLFHDYFGADENVLFTPGHWGVPLCVAFPALAALHGLPFMLYGVGAGPLTSEVGRRLTRLAFERANPATVRDQASADLVKSIGVTRAVEVTADPAWLIAPTPHERVRTLLREAGVPESPAKLVAVAIRHWAIGVAPDDWQARLAAALDELAADATILFVPFQAGTEGDLTNDRAASERVRDRMRHARAAAILTNLESPSDVQGVFSVCDLVIAMRLHAGILAAGAGTPVLGLAYDAKVSLILDQAGLGSQVLQLAEFSPQELVLRARAMLDSREAIRAGLQAQVPQLRASAARDTAALVALLDRGQPVPLSAEWEALLRRALLIQIGRAATQEARGELQQLERDADRRALAEREAAHAADQRLLAERTEDLAAMAASLAEARADLEWTPAHSRRRLRRRVRTTARAWRRGAARVTRMIVGPTAWLGERLFRTLVPASARRALHRTVSARLMSWPDYLFDRYRRTRRAMYGGPLTGLRESGEAGLVSVVLPAFNGAALIRESIDSVVAQTHRAFELIIVDDGSTDETAQIGESYSRLDPRVRVVRQSHSGLPQALSHGFRRARGEFLTWTSCDNRMKPDFLAKMVACLKRHPDWDMTYANLDIIGERGERLIGTAFYDGSQRPAGSGHVHLPSSSAQLNVVANNSVGAAFLYRARVASLIGDYSPFRFVMEDYDYWMRVNALMTLRHADFDEPVYDYRFHSRSLTARWSELNMLKNRERLMVFDDFRRDFCLTPMLWVIDGAGHVAKPLADRVRRAGHVVYDGHVSLATLPRAAVPVVHVHATISPEAAVRGRADLPATAVKVLLTTEPTLPARVSEAWDLCCAIGAASDLPRLPREYQGWLGAADVDTAFQAIDIRTRSVHLAALEAMAEGGDRPALRATVVVCTRRRTDQLMATLRAVAAQTLDPAAYELIVVGNDLHDQTVAAGVEELRGATFSGRPDRLRFVRCPVPGLSIARNAGLAEARGECVAFLDDDAVPAEDWLAHLTAAYDSHPEAGVIGGCVVLAPQSPRPAALKRGWEKYWSEYAPEHRQYVDLTDWKQFPFGANWSARRAALRQAGGFRTRYGRSGDNYWGGEELVAACLVQRLGYAIGVAPQARAVHHVSPDRFTFAHVRRTMAAGHQVGHRARRDLYLPHERNGLLPGLGQILTDHVDRALEPGGDRWLDAMYRKGAQMQLIAAELADFRRRVRRPIVAAR